MTTLGGGPGSVMIDGHVYHVIRWDIHHTVGTPDHLEMELVSGPKLLPTAGPFIFEGITWYLTGMTISSTTTGPITMQLQATSKTIPHSPKALPPKSRLKLPSLSLPPPVDVHKHCVPIDHYNDLKTFMAKTLAENHSHVLMISDDDLKEWEDWRVMHSKDGSGLHTFVAVHPSVVIDEDPEDDDAIPF